MSNPIEKALKILANSCYYWHTSEEPGGPYTAWRGEGEPDEIAEEALATLRSDKYHIEEVPEGMKNPMLVDGDRLYVILYTTIPATYPGGITLGKLEEKIDEYKAYLHREVENNTRGQ